MPKLFDVLTRKIYDENGERKLKWYKVGYLKETDKNTKFLRLFQQPDTEFFISEKEKLPNIPY